MPPSLLSLLILRHQLQDRSQLFPNLRQRVISEKIPLRMLNLWFGWRLPDSLQKLACSLDSELLLVEQVFDLQEKLDILPPVHALALIRFLGGQFGELGFPKTQDVRFDGEKATHFSYFEIELIGYLGSSGGNFGDSFTHRPSAMVLRRELDEYRPITGVRARESLPCGAHVAIGASYGLKPAGSRAPYRPPTPPWAPDPVMLKPSIRSGTRTRW